jgi:hypothetical protein
MSMDSASITQHRCKQSYTDAVFASQYVWTSSPQAFGSNENYLYGSIMYQRVIVAVLLII